jgi:UDPglucose 6-dehydrogenase
MMRLSVIGLGKLGAPLAAVLASRGHHVIGVDLNPEYVRLLASGKAPVEEPQLQHLIDKNRARLKATTSYEDAVLGSDLTFVIVPTPSAKSGVFTNKYVVAAVQEVGKALRKKTGYHVVNITSTVMPGSTEGEIREALEKHSGRRVGEDVGLCYNPEFIALGSVVRDMLNPDFILLGESDSRAGDIVENVYLTSCDSNPPIRRTNLINAELAKISVNTYVTTRISYANMLAEICERLPGADVNVVTAAIGLDSRIGIKYLRGGIGYGGPCFPRDNIAFAALAHRIGARADLAEATHRLNRYQIDRLVAMVRSVLPAGGCVGVLGLSYKPDTCVIEESQGVALAARFLKDGHEVVVYDPKAMDPARSVLGGRAIAAESAEACVRRADVVVITTPWPEFGRLSAEAFVKAGRKTVAIDCWRVLPEKGIGAVAELLYVGTGSEPPVSEPALRRAAGE